MSKPMKQKPIKGWAGFCNNKLDFGWEINQEVIYIYEVLIPK